MEHKRNQKTTKMKKKTQEEDRRRDDEEEEKKKSKKTAAHLRNQGLLDTFQERRPNLKAYTLHVLFTFRLRQPVGCHLVVPLGRPGNQRCHALAMGACLSSLPPKPELPLHWRQLVRRISLDLPSLVSGNLEPHQSTLQQLSQELDAAGAAWQTLRPGRRVWRCRTGRPIAPPTHSPSHPRQTNANTPGLSAAPCANCQPPASTRVLRLAGACWSCVASSGLSRRMLFFPEAASALPASQSDC